MITHCSVVRNTAECVFIFYHVMFIFSTKPNGIQLASSLILWYWLEHSYSCLCNTLLVESRMQSPCNIFHWHESYAIFRCDLDYDAGCKGLRTFIPNIETSKNFGSQPLLSFMIILVLETEIKTYKRIIKYSLCFNKVNFPWRYCVCLILCASRICVKD